MNVSHNNVDRAITFGEHVATVLHHVNTTIGTTVPDRGHTLLHALTRHTLQEDSALLRTVIEGEISELALPLLQGDLQNAALEGMYPVPSGETLSQQKYRLAHSVDTLEGSRYISRRLMEPTDQFQGSRNSMLLLLEVLRKCGVLQDVMYSIGSRLRHYHTSQVIPVMSAERTTDVLWTHVFTAWQNADSMDYRLDLPWAWQHPLFVQRVQETCADGAALLQIIHELNAEDTL